MTYRPLFSERRRYAIGRTFIVRLEPRPGGIPYPGLGDRSKVTDKRRLSTWLRNDVHLEANGRGKGRPMTREGPAWSLTGGRGARGAGRRSFSVRPDRGALDECADLSGRSIMARGTRSDLSVINNLERYVLTPISSRPYRSIAMNGYVFDNARSVSERAEPVALPQRSYVIRNMV